MILYLPPSYCYSELCRRASAMRAAKNGAALSLEDDMPISSEVRRLQAKWQANTGWPQRLDWIQIHGLRGWTGQRFNCNFPIMAVVGENGSGKSTILQCAAAIYLSPVGYYASDFFPETTWEKVRRAEIRYAVRCGDKSIEQSLRKPGPRWRGNRDRQDRDIRYFDLNRIQPVSGRVGYAKLAKTFYKETSSTLFEKARLDRFSQIMGHQYDLAKMALTNADEKKKITVLGKQQAIYSGFHQGSGEATVADLLEADFPKYGLVLIDEIETSLHPRSQRRLIRDLADRCRERDLQIILTTHSPYVLDELPLTARAYIITAGGKQIVYGVSPDFAMSKMDDEPHYEADLYVEDERAETMLVEILAAHAPALVSRCRIIPYGAASVGQTLGQMVANKRFPRPSCVFLDGDGGRAPGCINLPGDDAPEIVVFEALKTLSPQNWANAAYRTARDYSQFADACSRAMTLGNHHDWVSDAASKLVLRGDVVWQVLCAEWAKECLDKQEADKIVRAVEAVLAGFSVPMVPVSVTIGAASAVSSPVATSLAPAALAPAAASHASTEKPPPSQQSLFVPKLSEP